MKKLIIISAILLFVKIGLFAQKTPLVNNPDFPFEKFDKNRIDVGTLYVYEYSRNSENFEPSNKVYYYLKTLNEIECFWISLNKKKSTHYNRFEMNWDKMMLESSTYMTFKDKNDLVSGESLKNNININYSKKILQINLTNRVEEGFKEYNYNWEFNSIPTYFYTITSLTPLWFTLRFYPIRKENITVNSNANDHNIEFKIKYEGKEKVKVPFGEVLCYKFEIVPQLSFFMKLFHSPKKAFIWLTSEDDHRNMVKYRNNNEKNSFEQSMEYRLAERKKMTPEEWEQFKVKNGAKVKEATNFMNW